ncbi:MerR family transcriptional regulator [Domibacillus sp. 8LH]|jgi:MerR family transcriptional regulator, glutamine synthetase repressor|uniref:MerR family transcriptional regulator n=1 Tax=Domibacillus TaxID=1433999 RepID=UPI001F59973E|nr:MULTISPECIES: MerR family transcriptional regulator [Domibacillus]MCI2255523.1 MerR family transcriptional regulator [Domibacillus sp. PGB-M46]MCM3787482.1 MerR family transcriptional regulator [Domibacillus indicus]WNS79640.1 MerR family transcriptional regulator [Domibacillus sp. DTU_2020_1001157_1_SI_ALB_TIR_016]
MSSQIRRTMPLFPMGTVMKLTDLTARQIRYYEQHQLITPDRSDGNRRLYSLNDIDRLLEVKDLLDQGINMAGIKKILLKDGSQELELETRDSGQKPKKEFTDEELRKLLRKELINAGRFNRSSGMDRRFFH